MQMRLISMYRIQMRSLLLGILSHTSEKGVWAVGEGKQNWQSYDSEKVWLLTRILNLDVRTREEK